jgi:hypothetical protein
VVRQIEEIRNALGMPPSETRPDGHPDNGSLVVQQSSEENEARPGEIQIGWLPGWEDLEEGTH